MVIVTDRNSYYQQPYVLYELCKQLQYKYLSIRKQSKKDPKKFILSRYYLGYNIDLLKDSLERNNVLNDKTAKIYGDLATFKDEKGNTPLFNYDKTKRKEDKNKFNELYLQYMKSYNFAIDLDSDKDIMVAWKDAKKIKKLFDDYKLPYSIKFSGSRGFHLLIEDKYFSNRMKPQNKVLLFGRIANVIMGVCGIKSHNDGGTFDDSIYDDRRIFKIAYSLNYKDGKESVCLPLSDFDFDTFKIEKMELSYVMKNCKIFKRGMLTRDYGLSEKQLKRNVALFLKEIK